MDKKSAPTLSPLRKGLAEATKRPQAIANPFGITPLRRPLASRTIAALLFFALVNLTWSKVGFGKLAPDDFPFDTWTSLAVQDFLHIQKGAPDVAFLGSSLVLFPAGSVDADMLNREVDGPRHHNSLFFEKKFAEQTGKHVSTFNFALPGEMPSDAYLITKFLFDAAKRPDVIVYGVGPRDFMDNLLPSPSATDPFRHLARFGDYSNQIDKISPELPDRLNWELGRLCFPYGHKDDLSRGFERGVSKVVIGALPKDEIVIPLAVRRFFLPEYKSGEVGFADCMFQPYVNRPRPAFVDNLVEYRKRYKTLKWNTFLTQMEFLSDTMDIAKQRGIRFVLVSMPITELNRNLIGSTAATAYRKTLRILAQSKGASFIDLDSTGDYKLSDYEDTVHLHSGGGRKMLTAIAQSMAKNTEIRQALAAPKMEAASWPSAGRQAGTAIKSAANTTTPHTSEPAASSAPSKVATRKESFL